MYPIGGATSNGFCTFNEEYDTTIGTWATKASMPTARSSFAIASFQDKIYCIGGYALVTTTDWQSMSTKYITQRLTLGLPKHQCLLLN